MPSRAHFARDTRPNLDDVGLNLSSDWPTAALVSFLPTGFATGGLPALLDCRSRGPLSDELCVLCFLPLDEGRPTMARFAVDRPQLSSRTAQTRQRPFPAVTLLSAPSLSSWTWTPLLFLPFPDSPPFWSSGSPCICPLREAAPSGTMICSWVWWAGRGVCRLVHFLPVRMWLRLGWV